MSVNLCPECHGARLKPEVLAVTIGGKNIQQVTDMPVAQCQEFFQQVEFTDRELTIGRQVLKEINARLGFLAKVGLEYLTLSRAAGTLSGGEAQRIRLATQIGSGLVGVLYILDEPSIGLHQRDNNKLLEALKNLRNMGNTLLVVEHDEDTMRVADHIVDIGPGAGSQGGYVVAQGTAEEIMAVPESVTGQYLSHKKIIPVPEKRRQGNGNFLEILGAEENNLKNVHLKLPLGVFTVITGVSGSGKSTLLIMIGALDTPTSGKVLIDGKDIFSMNDKKLTVFRRRNIGFIFQAFNLVPELTVEQNIIFAVLLYYQKPEKKYLEELLTVLNLKERRNHLPSQLSGGQQQRVAIGRALITRPSLILADEPTGNLDSQNSSEVIALLKETSKKYEQTIIMITHNRSIAQTADRVLQVSDGTLTDFGRCRE